MSRDKWDKYHRQSKVGGYDPIRDFRPKHPKRLWKKIKAKFQRGY